MQHILILRDGNVWVDYDSDKKELVIQNKLANSPIPARIRFRDDGKIVVSPFGPFEIVGNSIKFS